MDIQHMLKTFSNMDMTFNSLVHLLPMNKKNERNQTFLSRTHSQFPIKKAT